MVYTTACVSCRKVRIKCQRESQGRNTEETCDRCRTLEIDCVTVKRRVGRQAGVKNRRKRDPTNEQVSHLVNTEPSLSRDPDHLPNPLHVLASEAVRRQPTPETDEAGGPSDTSFIRNSYSILDKYSEWINKVHPTTGRGLLMKQLDTLLSHDPAGPMLDLEEPPVFSGRIDMSRPDAAPERDVINLLLISLQEAHHLFDSFMKLITNGAMHFDPRIHTLAYVRERSSFLLAVILAVASTYKSLNSSAYLHVQLMTHAVKLERIVRNEHLKSIEIIQALSLLASWTQVPTTLAREKTWLYVSHAIALAVELRLDSPLPYCVQSDPTYNPSTHDLLVRNAHRVCLLMFIHDRNMAMVAGRYPVFPESEVTSTATLTRWGKHAKAYRYDAPMCASVALRKMVTELHLKLGPLKSSDWVSDKKVIDQAMSAWRTKWSTETQSTLEYDIIARFSTFVLALTLMKKKQYTGSTEVEARRSCEVLAFDVCCAAINHYKSWTGLLNSCTFDTSMVAFCAIYTIQSIKHTSSSHLSDWSLFRLATLQELVAGLESQAKERHSIDNDDSLSVVDAMARQLSRGLRLLLQTKNTSRLAELLTITDTQALFSVSNDDTDPFGARQHVFNPQPSQPDELNQFMISSNALPFIPEWNLESLLPDMNFNWDANQQQEQSLDLPLFDFNQ